MNNTDDILQTIYTFLVVVAFLLNTGRGLKAIEVCKECLNFLHNEVSQKEEQIFNFLNTAIYKTLFQAYFLVTDYTNAKKILLDTS